jgi:predicted nucleotidyltransferase
MRYTVWAVTSLAPRPAVNQELGLLLRQTVERLAAGFGDRLLAVALFGSTVRGDAQPDSDVDLLAIVSGLPRSWERSQHLREALPRLPLTPALSFLLETPEEFDADVHSLQLDLALDAQVLFEKEGWLSARLDRLRALIRAAKLRRRPDLFWEWEEPPQTRHWSISWQGVVR